MATVTVANGGGFWDVGSTYVGGVAPTNTDDIVFTSTSGAFTARSTGGPACLSINFTNYTNTFTINSGATPFVGSVTLSTGMTIVNNGTLSINKSGTLTSNGVTFPGTVTIGAASSTNITWADNWVFTGTVSIGTTINTWTGSTVTFRGNYSNSVSVNGTTNIVFATTGTQSISSANAINVNVTINASGTVNIGTTTIGGNGKTFTYTAGVVNVTGTLTISNAGNSYIMNTAGINWNNITCSGNQTLVLGSNLTCLGTFTQTQFNITFSGAYNFSCATWSATTGMVTLVSSQTYTITTALTITATLASTFAFVASLSNSTKAKLILSQGATSSLAFVNATDIDSSGGLTIWSRKGTLTRTTNWKLLVPPSTIGASN